METLKSDLRHLLMEVTTLPDGFDEKADLYGELGVGSMKAMELLMALEERYGVRVPDEKFIEATSLDRLTLMIGQLKG